MVSTPYKAHELSIVMRKGTGPVPAPVLSRELRRPVTPPVRSRVEDGDPVNMWITYFITDSNLLQQPLPTHPSSFLP